MKFINFIILLRRNQIINSNNMEEKKEIEAIHKHDLEILLQNLNLLNNFRAGGIKCQFCNDVLRNDNFGAIYPEQKKILFSCSKLECLAKVSKK